MKQKNMKKIIPDTSILIRGVLSEMVKSGKLEGAEILIPKAAIDELQAQASRGKEIGFTGLEEIKKIRKEGTPKGVKVTFTGKRPTLEEIHLAKKGRIDALIRDVAEKANGTLYTGDYVQALVGEAEGVSVEYIPKPIRKKVQLDGFFKPDMQSLHLKVGVPPMAKVGKPGQVKLVKLKEKPSTEDEIKSIVDEVVYKAMREDGSFVEMGKAGAMVVQLGNYRISIARPPFSEALELTAVRPIAKVKLKDYKMHEELEKRLSSQSQGLLIAGAPGSGKSSFASALAEFLSEQDKIVKTFEMPRDLQVGPEITQYGPLEGDWSKSADILLLVRPDYTIFDEVRRTPDFKVFSDMRLAGVGMVGVIHSTDPVSAIQRFVGRVELGMIPHIIDTVVYIKDGKIEKVYELALLVKVPTGMTEADLARPVVEIRDFASKKLEYEIYPYGSENVIIPVDKGARESPLKELAKKQVYRELSQFDPNVKIEMVGEDRLIARVKGDVMARLIGKKGQNIDRIEKKLGIHISVEPVEPTIKSDIPWQFEEVGATVNIHTRKNLTGQQVDVYDGEEYIFSPFVGKKGAIKVRKASEVGRKILKAIASDNLRILV